MCAAGVGGVLPGAADHVPAAGEGLRPLLLALHRAGEGGALQRAVPLLRRRRALRPLT